MGIRSYRSIFKKSNYKFSSIAKQVLELKQVYDNVNYIIKRDKFIVIMKIQPTQQSIIYDVKICCRVNDRKVKIFVINPQIKKTINPKIPHMYRDNSLCLYYFKYNEWSITDSWAETLIPWTSLWLFYYEIWNETGEWLGGGVHPN